MSRNVLITMFIFVLVSCTVALVHAQGASDEIEQVNITETLERATLPGAPLYFEWLPDWKLLAIVLMFISIAAVIIVRFLSTTFHLPRVQAWADVELGQVFVSAIILIGIIGIFSFIDWLMYQFADYIITNLDPTLASACNASAGINTTCGLQLSKEYVKELIDLCDSPTKDIIRSNKEIGEVATFSFGITSNTIYVGFLGFSYSPNAGKTMLLERNARILDYYTTVLGALKAQHFFLDKIIYTIAPFSIIAGIILRSFFITRRVGGLLIAFGSVLIGVVPLFYMFMWYTFANTVYGGFAGADIGPPSIVNCPDECLLKPPLYVITADGTTYEITDETEYDSVIGQLEEDGIDWSAINCTDACDGCDIGCRVLPVTPEQCTCNETACAECPVECKVFRERSDCYENCNGSVCPDFCKADYSSFFDPSNNCSTCIGCPTHCRYWYLQSDGSIAPPSDGCNTPECRRCECKIILPTHDLIDCNIGCFKCPLECRVNYESSGGGDVLPSYCDTPECDNCPEYCKSDYANYIMRGCAVPPEDPLQTEYQNCNACPASCAMDNLPQNQTPAMCDEMPLEIYCNTTFCPNRIDETPPICIPYNESAMSNNNCTKCKEECRFIIRPPADDPSGASASPPKSDDCDDDDCNVYCDSRCKKEVTAIVNSDCPYYNASGTGCELCPYECRVIVSDITLNCPDACNECNDGCKIDLTGRDVVTCLEPIENGSTNTSCDNCPLACRVADSVTVCDIAMTEHNCNETACPTECKIEVSDTYMSIGGGCLGCPLACRVAGELPSFCMNYPTCFDDYLFFGCSDVCKFQPPVKPCDDCFECNPDCLNNPPFRTDCAKVCSIKGGYVSLDMGVLTGAISAGTGANDIAAVAGLALPGIVLPLIMAFVLLSFIQKLSGTLGGDIEIPGIGKFL